jgi:hypothetical protein
MGITDEDAAEIEADCLEAVEFWMSFLTEGDREQPVEWIAERLKIQRPAMVQILAEAKVPNACIPQYIRAIARTLRRLKFGNHAGRIDAALDRLKATSRHR